jgi:hypothetical protein
MGVREDKSVHPLRNDLAHTRLAAHNAGNPARHGFEGRHAKRILERGAHIEVGSGIIKLHIGPQRKENYPILKM